MKNYEYETTIIDEDGEEQTFYHNGLLIARIIGNELRKHDDWMTFQTIDTTTGEIVLYWDKIKVAKIKEEWGWQDEM